MARESHSFSLSATADESGLSGRFFDAFFRGPCSKGPQKTVGTSFTNTVLMRVVASIFNRSSVITRLNRIGNEDDSAVTH